MQRDVHVKTVTQFTLRQGMILQLLQPLYGLSESCGSCFQQYRTFLLTKLGLSSTDRDMSFKYEHYKDELQGKMAIYADDTLACGKKHFQKLMDLIPETFESKQRELTPFLFAGVKVHKRNEQYILELQFYANAITELSMDVTLDNLPNIRHKLAWLPHKSPEVLLAVNILSQVAMEYYEPDDIK